MGCASRRRTTEGFAREYEAEDANHVSWRPIVMVAMMLFIDGLGYGMSLAPQTQLFENIVCRQYYKVNSTGLVGRPSEEMCKDPAVQDVVAELFGWQTFFDGIPGLVLAIWFGVLADKQGRRRVLFLSLVGQVLGACWVLFICWAEFPLKLIWLSSAFLVIGGGSTVTGAVSMMIITDASPEKYRSNIFFYAQAALIVAELVGPATGSLLMTNSLWLPLLLGLGCTVITSILAGTIPETLHRREGGAIESEHEDLSDDLSLQRTLRRLLEHVYKTLKFIASHRSVLFLVLTFLVVDFSRQSLGVLLQYLSTRYSIPIAKASILLSVRAFAQLVTFIAILPLLDLFVSKKLGLSARVKDFLLSRLSIAFIMICFAILVLAPNLSVVVIGLAFYTLGNGFSSFARSLLSSLIEKDMVGTLFTTLSMMDTLGSLLAGPIVAKTFSWSLRLDGIWKGMPYVMSFIICGLASIALSRAGSGGLPDKHVDDDEESRSFLARDSSAS
ncbi:major facilitator superfamily domain-containing protein [Colletotrichum navitas]|uniref:Major facilitator superfamily domain-containing protein n=1 Tax=Colletotrichum navitas TaxID=681940 RepID=A0AAD8PM81_9PEZI|nr:major facilitator superfamily domain-containing protein [Colletotrichum navitas]KAK1570186.1 major facilitator superfamily domain-containing protein [Colletotrichum navitas]